MEVIKMGEYERFGYSQRRRGSKVFWIITAIIAFATIYYPFFGGSLRYEISSNVNSALTEFGSYILLAGLILFVLGVIIMFATQSLSRAIRFLALGYILMVFASYFVDPGHLGIIAPPSPVGAPGAKPPKGYH